MEERIEPKSSASWGGRESLVCEDDWMCESEVAVICGCEVP